MFQKVVVANRGAVAIRILRTLRQLGIGSVAVYSEADADAPHVVAADESYCIGPAPARESYLHQDRLTEVLRQSGADALHPGYGFLSENAEFADRVTEAGACFIGPSARLIETMGHKTRARELANCHGLPVIAGTGPLQERDQIIAAAQTLGFPLLVKPAAGGGGIGILAAREEAELVGAVDRARSMAERGFGNSAVYLERLLERPRHIEFQVLCDLHGGTRTLFERDCSVQRRHQKIIEEAPAPGIPRTDVDELSERIEKIMQAIGYNNIGTIEMLRGVDGQFAFIEMNTRLQVEHGVTEEVAGVDLVGAQIRAAAGERLEAILPGGVAIDGHAIEARVYAEDPKRFLPSPGPLKKFRPPSGIRVETGYTEGMNVTPYYDPLLAKVIAHERTRSEAINSLIAALAKFDVDGVKTNIPALLDILRMDSFRAGAVHTGIVGEFVAQGRP